MLASFSPPQRQPLRVLIDSSLPLAHCSTSPDSPSPLSEYSLTTSGLTPSTGDPEWFICNVICLFDFESDDPDHLSFTRNEILTVVKMEESGWWAAMRPEGDRLGWIPSSFVERLTETAVEEPYQEGVHPWIHNPEESNARNSESVSDSECIQLGDTLSSVSDVTKYLLLPSNQLRHEDSGRGNQIYDSFFSLPDYEPPPYGLTRSSSSPVPSMLQPSVTPPSPVFEVSPKPPEKLDDLQLSCFSIDSGRSLPLSPYPRRPRRLAVLVNDHESLSCLSAMIDGEHSPGFHSFDSPHVKETFDVFNRRCTGS
ncbi:uncharacterized protein F5147DRAFT_768289 [Suillus discolor]|uniref:SH3 domain-containing protein n=1 Tax=Suillus discolor TaxID=1912936 RepID=A0A9P7FGX3_9AGAM|nr:uncharacterized protein F5147DRAFT_768289 [Suillus discolor]KAG2118154.1 hypothetical protein F5147DRAFT_768289 [Suillus discolor]